MICFFVQFVYINNVQLTQGTPFPMFLENTCVCKNEICPDVLFTFTPPDVVEHQLHHGGFDAPYPEVTSLEYLTAWDFTNMHFTGKKIARSGSSTTSEYGYGCYCDFFVTDFLRTTVPELGNKYDAPTWKIECKYNMQCRGGLPKVSEIF